MTKNLKESTIFVYMYIDNHDMCDMLIFSSNHSLYKHKIFYFMNDKWWENEDVELRVQKVKAGKCVKPHLRNIWQFTEHFR